MPIIFLLLAILACYMLLYPYPATLFLVFCISILTYPLFDKMRNKYGDTKALIFYVFSMLLAIILPITGIALMVVPQAINGIKLFQQWRNTGWEISPVVMKYIDMVEAWMTSIPEMSRVFDEVSHFIAELSNNFAQFLNTIVSYSISGAAGLAGGLFNFLWHVFLFVILTSLCVLYAKPVKKLASKVFEKYVGMLDRYLVTIRAALQSVVMGILLVALFQGIACTVGFIIFQVPEPLFWGLLACLVAPIPLVGTAFVWVPLSFVLWFIESPTMSLGLVAWGMLVVAAVDNFFRPYFLSRGIRAPFFVLFLSILCGLAVFGSIGLIAGPVLVAFALQCVAEAVMLFDLDLKTINTYSPQKEARKKSLIDLFHKRIKTKQ